MKHSLPGLLLALAGCVAAAQSPSSSGTASHSSHGASSARASSRGPAGSSSPSSATSGFGGSTGGASSSSPSASSSAASGGSTGSSSGTPADGGESCVTSETSCPEEAICPVPASCATGTGFASQLVDYISCTPVGSGTITADDRNGVPDPGVAATTASNGYFSLCLPTGVPFTLQGEAAGYPTTYYPELLDPDGGYFAQVYAISSEELQAFATLFPDGLSQQDAVIFIKVKASVCGDGYSGWSFGLALPDGGAVPDGGYQLVYFDSSFLPDPSLTATSSHGAAAFYNLDPSIAPFLEVDATHSTPPGACAPLNLSLGMTGRVYISGGAVSLQPIILP